jgi:hypothetical protein
MMRLWIRFSIRVISILCFFPFLGTALKAADQPQPVSLNWLGNQKPPVAGGVSWGVPWPKGAVQKSQTFTLTTAAGKALPLQSWPMAYWPDGSLKWSGFATVAGPDIAGPLKLNEESAPASTGAVVQVRQSETGYEIDTGRLKAIIPKSGDDILLSMSVDGKEVARNGHLVCILQDGPDGNPEDSPRRQKYVGKVEKITLEQSGPVRAVVKLEGKHELPDGTRKWLPFVVRLYFYAGQDSVRMVHTIVYDGNEQKDFIRGLGVVFSVPMREEVQNHHVRFSGEGSGLWAEPVQPMVGRSGRFVANPETGADVYPDQIAGKRVPNRNQVNARSQGWLTDWAVWDDFKLAQLNPDGFTIEKRTNPQSCWLACAAGKRASGLVFVGDVSGGLAVSLQNFWQSYPTSLEVRAAGTKAAELSVWMWSPDATVMDLRHYDTKAHGLEAAYEDVQPGFSTPVGVARTSELTLFATSGVPSKEETARMAQAGSQPPLLVCTPEYMHSVPAFGVWSLQDRSTPFKKAVEGGLDATVDFYLKQVDEQNWYGFWDYGDVRHSYDDVRHVWRYDLGGMAWDNSELGTDMWLWYSFLRSGRADIFRMAEAMTRHTGEVDCYHLGRFAGLGSRHNVRHWGDGAKEARISQAAYRRIYYYLTTDERTGDIMHEMVNADYKATEFDPMREAQPITEAEKKVAPGRVRLGPDWLAFVGNWMTEWERTGDTKWRDKILIGVDCLAKMPFGMRTGRNLVMGYDPATGKLYQLSDEPGTYNLATIMGGGEVAMELSEILDDPQWQRLWLQYCRLYAAPKDVLLKDNTTGTEGADGKYLGGNQSAPRLAAFAYMKTKNPMFAQRAIASLRGRGQPPRTIEGPDSLNPVEESRLAGTNGAAQTGLNTIEVLEMCADQLPMEMPPQNATRGARRGGRGGAGGGAGAANE